MSKPYPDKALVVKVLAEVAERTAHESSSDHPEDIATSMVFAIENAALAIEVLWKRGVL